MENPTVLPAVSMETKWSAEGTSLRAIFDHSQEFIGLLSIDGILLEANPAALRFGGVTRDEVVGQPFASTAWWRHSAAAREQLHRAIRTAAAGTFVRYEVEQHGAADGLACVDFSITPVRDATGQVVALVVEGRDVSERRRAEDALRTSEAHFAGIISLAADAIISVDGARLVTLFNRSASEIFGYQPEEIVGQPLDLLLLDEDQEPHGDGLRWLDRPQSYGSGAARRVIYGRRRDGSRFPVDASISRQPTDPAAEFTLVLRDITDRVAAETERATLLARESLARSAAEAAERRAEFLAEAGALLDASLEYSETLASLTRLLVPALSRYCVIGMIEDGAYRNVRVQHASAGKLAIAQRLLDLPRELQQSFTSRPALQTGRPQLVADVTDDHLQRLAVDADHLEILRSLAPTSYMDLPLVARGNVIGAIVLATDAESSYRYGEAELYLAVEVARRAALSLDNARLYRAARRATQLRDEMLGVVSHDLRTPLSVIGMSLHALETEAVRDALGGHDAARDALHTMRDSVEWLQRMLQDLLDVASIEGGRLRMERRMQDPMIPLMRAVELMEPLAADHSLELESDIPDHLPSLPLDGERMLQVLTNLLGNAIKFTPPGGHVTLRARVLAGLLHISVTDTGAGIPADELPFIFDRFWHSRRSSEVRGTGLGLTIVRGIVEAHNGRIAVHSQPGQGSEFRISLPLAAA